MANKKLTLKEEVQIKSEINTLSKCNIATSMIKAVNVTTKGNEYILKYNNIEETVTIKNSDKESVTIIASDKEKSNVLSFMKDGRLILDGHEVKVSQLEPIDITQRLPIYKSQKSLSPYGSLTSSDYNKYLSSGKQNVALGEAIGKLTASALAAVLTFIDPFKGITVSLVGIAINISDVITSVDPKTEYLGCIVTTYIASSYDYQYISKFYANTQCTGTYDRQLSYEHFIIY